MDQMQNLKMKSFFSQLQNDLKYNENAAKIAAPNSEDFFNIQKDRENLMQLYNQGLAHFGIDETPDIKSALEAKKLELENMKTIAEIQKLQRPEQPKEQAPPNMSQTIAGLYNRASATSAPQVSGGYMTIDGKKIFVPSFDYAQANPAIRTGEPGLTQSRINELQKNADAQAIREREQLLSYAEALSKQQPSVMSADITGKYGLNREALKGEYELKKAKMEKDTGDMTSGNKAMVFIPNYGYVDKAAFRYASGTKTEIPIFNADRTKILGYKPLTSEGQNQEMRRRMEFLGYTYNPAIKKPEDAVKLQGNTPATVTGTTPATPATAPTGSYSPAMGAGLLQGNKAEITFVKEAKKALKGNPQKRQAFINRIIQDNNYAQKLFRAGIDPNVILRLL